MDTNAAAALRRLTIAAIPSILLWLLLVLAVRAALR
jgi:hypothetical protein